MPAPKDPQRPFERDAFFDDPGIVGARWWNRAFDVEAEASRRQAMTAIAAVAIVVGGIAVVGVGGVVAAIANAPDRTWRSSLGLQREIGWSVGSFDEPLTWPWQTVGSEDGRTPLARVAATMAAKRYAPFEVKTRLEALGAVATGRLPGETYTVRDLRDVVRPGRTATMTSDLACGKALAAIFAGKDLQTLVIVDCSGPRSVAFAAGASDTFEPVLVLDNWPHPNGVVSAHSTLGALASFEPDFAKGASLRGATPPPLLILEHERTDPLIDAETYFDNRYFVTLPAAETLKKWSLTRVLLVIENEAGLPESGDVAGSLVDYAAAGLDVRLLTLTTFKWDGSYPWNADGFFYHYPWSPASGPTPVPLPLAVSSWRPGSTKPALSPKTPPPHFGESQVYTRKGVLVDVPSYGGSRDRSGGGSNGG